jgi:hypothetical protein
MVRPLVLVLDILRDATSREVIVRWPMRLGKCQHVRLLLGISFIIYLQQDLSAERHQPLQA